MRLRMTMILSVSTLTSVLLFVFTTPPSRYKGKKQGPPAGLACLLLLFLLP